MALSRQTLGSGATLADHLRQPIVHAVIDNFLTEGELNLERTFAGKVREICGTVSRSVLNRGADPATDARTTY